MNLNKPIKILYGSSNPIYIQLLQDESSNTKDCKNTPTLPAKPKMAGSFKEHVSPYSVTAQAPVIDSNGIVFRGVHKDPSDISCFTLGFGIEVFFL